MWIAFLIICILQIIIYLIALDLNFKQLRRLNWRVIHTRTNCDSNSYFRTLYEEAFRDAQKQAVDLEELINLKTIVLWTIPCGIIIYYLVKSLIFIFKKKKKYDSEIVELINKYKKFRIYEGLF